MAPKLLFIMLAVLGQQVRIGTLPTIPNGIVSPPQVIQSPRPEYTEDARKAQIEGTVTIEAAFDISGNIKVLRVVKGLGHGLDENAIAVLKDWRFLPATQNGARVQVVGQIDVEFKLPTELYKVGGGVSAPTVLSKVDPEYPPDARDAHIQGTVVLDAIIRSDGTVEVSRITRSLDPRFDLNARKALEQWKFKPAIKDGKAVPVSLKIEVNFNWKK